MGKFITVLLGVEFHEDIVYQKSVFGGVIHKIKCGRFLRHSVVFERSAQLNGEVVFSCLLKAAAEEILS